MTESKFKYFAFISYSSKDVEWGRRLQKKLEHYRMPATLCSERGWKRTPINPVFFAPTDIQPGGLTEELQERQRASRNLIVICSPNSAQSEWVGKEIEFFHSLGRAKQIHFFIVDGTPHSGNTETECFNPVIQKLGLPEILGANVNEKAFRWPWLNRERAHVQLISKLLGVEFDAIWRRHRRLLIQKLVAWIVGLVAIILAMAFVWHGNQPVDICVNLRETSTINDSLPPLKDAVITLRLNNEEKTETLGSIKDAVTFSNVPHRFLNEAVRMTVQCENYLQVDTTLLLTKDVTIEVRRNPAKFGRVHFLLFDANQERGVPNQKLVVAGHETTSDNKGYVEMDISLDSQRTTYTVEVPSFGAQERLYMPNSKDQAIIVSSK